MENNLVSLEIKLTPDMMESMNIGVRYWGTKLEDLPPKTKQEISKALSNLNRGSLEGTGFYLFGNLHHAMGAAAVMLKTFRRKRLTAFCSSVSDMKEWIVERRERDGETYKEYFEDVGLLVLWGLGAEHRGLDKDGILKNMIFARHAKMNPTIWVSGLTPDELQKTYPRDIWQTINQNCVCLPVD